MLGTMPTYYRTRPEPPSRQMLDELRSERRAPVPYPAHHHLPAFDPDAPLFDFNFKQPWLGLFTMPRERFVLRVEHMPELARLAHEFNKNRPSGEDAVGPSNIVNAALDFILAHQFTLSDVPRQENIRERMAEVVYRRAFLRYMRHGYR